jgi:serine/threonine protein kinase
VLANGKMIAVKKVEQRWSSKEKCEILQKQFENEVNLLMELKHENIVELLNYCYEMHHERLPHNGKYIFCWQIDSLLCLEFLPEGSLDKRISGMKSNI